MPIYEYRCNKCRKKVSILTLRVSEKVDEKCEHCGSTSLTRLLSRFAMTRSEESRLDALADPSNLSGLDENDPKSMARWMKKMGREMGDELGGEDFDEMIDEMESGKGLDDDGGTEPSGGGSDDSLD
jgi:putative FmdB family regulatory protein